MIFKLLLDDCVARWKSELVRLKGEYSTEVEQDIMKHSTRQSWISHEASDLLCDDVACVRFIRKAILNRKDDFGNTVLHLAAWNEKRDMYDLLMELGCSPMLKNNDGLTPFSLSVRFGLWDMFNHIWTRHFTTALWSFGNVKGTYVEYAQFQTMSNGLMAFETAPEIDMCIDALAHNYMQVYKFEDLRPGSDLEDQFSSVSIRRKAVERVRMYCQDELLRILSARNSEDPDQKRAAAESSEKLGSNQKINESRYNYLDLEEKSAVKLITHFRPNNWYKNTKYLMEEVVLQKWSRGYYLVHVGDSLIPYCLLILLFCLMWWQRQVNVLEHNFWWATGPVTAPDPHSGIEAACGWSAMRDSNSGRLQAVLASYGVLSLLRLALIQSRLRPSDLDENVDWKISTDEMINFIYLNLEPFLHVVVAGLFLTIFFCRGAAGDSCDVWYLRTEKNCIAIAALGLFFNLFILCKAYKGFGLLILTWYRFLLADLFNFLAMYCMVFTAFLIALQTLHNANYEYLLWMDQTDRIFPQVQHAIGKIYPNAASDTNLTYLENTNPSNANLLLTSDVQLNGCQAYRRSLSDTAFALLEISFGDGLADALAQARSKPYECAGFTPDYLTGYLLVFWVFLTNIIIINMLIATMNITFDDQRERLSSVWLLDISKRVLRYEKTFPELAPQMARPEQKNSVFGGKYWNERRKDLYIIVHCIPELHLLQRIGQVLQVCWLYYGPHQESNLRENSPGDYKKYQNWIDEFEKNVVGCFKLNFWDFVWHPHMTVLKYYHRTSMKAVVFCKMAWTSYIKQRNSPSATDKEELEFLIFGLQMLKETLKNSKIDVVQRKDASSADSDRQERKRGGNESIRQTSKSSDEEAFLPRNLSGKA